MIKYRPVEIPEAQLEEMVVEAPELLEEGLQTVARQVPTARGPLDVLLVDSGNALVVAELKVVDEDGMLVQGIDYYDYVARNLESFARVYGSHQIDVSQEPRLLLVAPNFSQRLLDRIKWIDIDISLP